MFTDDTALDMPDYRHLRDGPVILFRRKPVLEAAIAALAPAGYRAIRLPCADGAEAFRLHMTAALKWQAQFGYAPWTGSLDALNDALRAEPRDSSRNTVICIEDFHRLHAADPDRAVAMLDIMASASRQYLLFGARLLIFVQTDDGDFHARSLGGTAAIWNPAEWLISDRGP